MAALRRGLRRLLLAGTVAVAGTLPANAEPAMWRVSDADSEVWLFGSIHLFNRERNWRTPAFEAALGAAEQVWFEMVFDADAYATITQLTMLDGTLRDGRKLSDLLSAEQNARLDQAIAAAGLDPLLFERLQPWMAEMTLAGGATAGSSAGVDMLIDAEVAPERKRGFESAAQQLGLFKDVPLAEQIDNLMSAADAFVAGGVKAELEAMTNAWEAGDVAVLDR